MATTPKGIYYPNDYNEIADIPEDMKKMAESIDGVFENTDSDLSDIKEEQTTQNNRLNSLEVDNTTNKSDILTNKQEINNIKTEQTEQNTNISTNATNIESLQEENENLKKVISQLPQVPGQGTSITLENTIEAQFTKFDVEGNSTQDGTPSPDNEVPIESAGDNENLFDTSLLPITKNGVTISKDSKGNVVLNGTPTITSGYIGFDFTLSSTYLKADTYTISVKNKIDGIGTTINQTTPGGIINLTMSDTAKVKTGTLTADLINGTMGVNVRYDVGTLDNFILNPKLEKSNKASGYSPYGMGSINEKIGNKNWNTSPLQDGSLTNGLPDTNYETCRTTNFIDIKPSTNYAFSINGILNRVVVSMYDKDKNFIATDGAGGYASSNGLFTTYANAYYIKYRAYNADKQLFLNGNIQLEEGSTASPFVEHKEQDYSIFVQQPMRSIGDVRDKFVIKSDNKKYERHYIGEVVLNGTENWNYEGGRFVLNFLISALDISGRQKVYSNYFEYLPSGSADYGIFVYKASSTNSQIYIYDKDYTTVEEFKAMLAEKYANGTPVYVDYILAEPLDLPCTEEQIDVLENKPSTYKDFTIIQSEDETPAYLEVAGIYDLNKLVTRTEVLESES